MGNNSTETSLVPVQVVGPGGAGVLTSVSAIAAGMNVFSLALKTDGTVWAWGFSGDGSLGNNSFAYGAVPVPVQVLGPGGVGVLNGVTAIAAGAQHALALKNDGTVWAWGTGANSVLGNNSTANSSVPVQVVGPGGVGMLTGVTAIAAGDYQSLALKSDGTVWSWGYGGNSGLGNNSTADSAVPVQVVGPGGAGVLTGVTAIAAAYHSLALKSDGTLWSWGWNSWGQLGNNTTTPSAVPVQVMGLGGVGSLTGVAAIAAKYGHSLVLKSDGSVLAWGWNQWGQLGNATNTSSPLPIQVLGPGGTGTLTDVTAISAGLWRSLAVKGDGAVWAWGAGQLGINTDTPSYVPVQVLGPGGQGFLNLGTGTPPVTQITFVATGRVTNVLNTNGLLSLYFPIEPKIGDLISYEYTFESATPSDGQVLPFATHYYGSIVSSKLIVGANPPYVFPLSGNGPGEGNYIYVYGGASSHYFTLVGSLSPRANSFSVDTGNGPAGYFPNNALPVVPPDLSQFTSSHFGFATNNGGSNDIVSGTLDTITLAGAPPPPPTACASQAAYWTVGTSSCGATYPGGLSGSTVTLTDSIGPETGTATASCTNGQFTVTPVTCVTAPPPPPDAMQTAGAPGSNPGVPYSNDPVNLVTGNYVLQATDLAVPGRGLPLLVARTYNSVDTTESTLGAGWRLNLHMGLTVGAGGDVYVANEDGRRDTYGSNGDGTFVAPAGVHAELILQSDGSYRLTRKNKSRFLFNAAGKLVRIEDRNTNAHTLSYDAQGRIAQISDTVGRVYTMAYSADHLISVTDPIGRTIHYTYDSQGMLGGVTNPKGEITSYTYDADKRLTEIINALGQRIVTNEYNGDARVARQVDARGSATTFAYDPANKKTTETDPLGRVTVHHYNENSRLTRLVDPLGHAAVFAYDGNNNRTSVTDKNGAITLFAYDGRDNLTSVTNPLGHSVAFTYDAADNLTRVTNARGAATAFTYDTIGNLTRIVDATGAATAFAYNTNGQRTHSTDARNSVTQYVYDGQGNVAAVTNALGNTTSLAYDGIGRLVSVTDPNGSSGSAQYDAVGRLSRVTDPLGHPTAFSYDAAGRLVGITDAKGQATGYAYDPNGNLAQVADALGHVTRYTYDAVNNRAGFTDANNHATAYAFDALNRLVAVTDPLGNGNRYQYDPNGSVTAATDANGATSRFEYDAAGRLVRITFGDGAIVAYQYDANGNRVAMDDARGRTTYEYDTLDRPTSIRHPNGTVGYGYDVVGNRSALTYPDGKAVQYAYDAVNRLQRVADWNGAATNYTYDAAGNLTGVMYPNGVAAAYGYDGGSRLTNLAYARFAKLIDGINYTLDELGNRVSVARLNPAVGLPYETEKYSYDALSQLVRIDALKNAGLPVLRTEYAYDAVGNRLLQSKAKQVGKGWRIDESTNYAYDAANRLLQAGSMAFAYDANGNRVGEEQANGSRRAYRYNGANRLVEVVENGPGLPFGRLSQYAYDGDGNKISQTSNDKAGLGPTNFLIDVASGLPVTLLESSPGQDLSYVYGLGLLSMHKPELGASGSHYYHPDGLGSTIALTGAGDAPGATYRYGAWGNLEKEVGSVPNRFRFTGEEEDPVTGLYYLRARWYDPRVGIFLGKDPFAGNPGDPQSLNRYAYVRNNPLKFVDASGLSPSENTASNQTSLSPRARRALVQLMMAQTQERAAFEGLDATYGAAIESFEAIRDASFGLLSAGTGNIVGGIASATSLFTRRLAQTDVISAEHAAGVRSAIDVGSLAYGLWGFTTAAGALVPSMVRTDVNWSNLARLDVASFNSARYVSLFAYPAKLGAWYLGN